MLKTDVDFTKSAILKECHNTIATLSFSRSQ
jgi:hypothetical protein